MQESTLEAPMKRVAVSRKQEAQDLATAGQAKGIPLYDIMAPVRSISRTGFAQEMVFYASKHNKKKKHVQPPPPTEPRGVERLKPRVDKKSAKIAQPKALPDSEQLYDELKESVSLYRNFIGDLSPPKQKTREEILSVMTQSGVTLPSANTTSPKRSPKKSPKKSPAAGASLLSLGSMNTMGSQASLGSKSPLGIMLTDSFCEEIEESICGDDDEMVGAVYSSPRIEMDWEDLMEEHIPINPRYVLPSPEKSKSLLKGFDECTPHKYMAKTIPMTQIAKWRTTPDQGKRDRRTFAGAKRMTQRERMEQKAEKEARKRNRWYRKVYVPPYDGATQPRERLIELPPSKIKELVAEGDLAVERNEEIPKQAARIEHMVRRRSTQTLVARNPGF